MNNHLYNGDSLTLEKEETDTEIKIKWLGKSIDREPGKVLNPIFYNLIIEGKNKNKRIIMSFSELNYMNSSTIMSISKFLERGKDNDSKITIQYDNERRWQKLSFNAMQIFKTDDDRIVFEGRSLA